MNSRYQLLRQASPLHNSAVTSSAYENYDVEPAATKGYGMVHLDQLAIEHILGAR